MVAAREQDRKLVFDIADSEFRVVVCASMRQALAALSQPDIDAVVCGVHFNDGNLFEFLEAVRADPRGERLPLVAVNAAEDLPAHSLNAVLLACREKGIVFLDATEMVRRLGATKGYAELRQRINDILG